MFNPSTASDWACSTALSVEELNLKKGPGLKG
jgi:hypothetical protein